MIKELGVQIYTVREFMRSREEVLETFKKIKAIGYSSLQTAGIPEFLSYQEYTDLVKEAGLYICGTHESLDKMLENTEKAIENHRILDTDIIGIGGYGFDGSDGTWRTFGYHTDEQLFSTIDKINRLSEAVCKEGFKFTYHNHAHEFSRLNGKTVMQHILDETDPQKVSVCLDLYWTQYGGADVRKTIEDLNGRIDIIHLKDMGRNESEPYMAPVGEGNMYWDGIIKAAIDTGVRHFVVEQDNCNGRDPFECLKQSFDYISEKFM